MTAAHIALLQQAVRLHQSGDLAAARQRYEAVLRLVPDQPDALHLLGVIHDQQGAHQAAIDLITKAVSLVPGQAEWHGNLATALLAAGRVDDAEAEYRRALEFDPQYVEGHYNLANLLRQRGSAEQAAASFGRALSLQPGHAQARSNLAMLLWEDMGDVAGATRQFSLLLDAAPGWATAHMNYGLFRLSSGNYEEGWQEYEWRWRSEDYRERDWGLGLPRWEGSAMPGKKLLLWGEQGVGDQILYGTMLRDAARISGADVTVAVDRRLVDLFRRSLSPDGIAVVERGHPVAADAQCPFGSIGRWVRRSAGDFAAAGFRLVADPVQTAALRGRYSVIADGRRLAGLSWRSGNRTIGADKSIPVAELLPMLRQPDVLWINLQYGDCRAELDAFRSSGVAIHDDASVDALQDMDRFAAQVAALDVVVSVSNTTIHVAGGVGIPSRLLLPAGRGRLWYWPAMGERCPWYENVRVLRQSAPGHWAEILATVDLHKI